jgi:hypothetical protein
LPLFVGPIKLSNQPHNISIQLYDFYVRQRPVVTTKCLIGLDKIL